MKAIKTNLKIGGITYKIIYKECDDEMGHTDFPKSEIYIDSRQTEDQKMATLIHEMLHCVNNQMSEEKVEFLAQALFQIFKDNFN